MLEPVNPNNLVRPVPERLAGKVAIVSGAGSAGSGVGTGRAIATLFAFSGASVALVDISQDRAEETRQMIIGSGVPEELTQVFVGDVGILEQCGAIVGAVLARFGRLDILVNNVGVAGPAGSAVDVDPAEWEQAMRVNVTAIMMLSKYAIPAMAQSGSGSIINIGSVMGLVGGAALFYGTSKGAVANMTRTMAQQHGPDGIRVNCIAPGQIYTPWAANLGMSDRHRKARQLRSLLHTEGTAWDVGHAAVFLASDEARWVTGIVLPVDGGFLAGEPRPPKQSGLRDRVHDQLPEGNTE